MDTRPLLLGFLSPLLALAAVPGQYIVEMSGDPVAVQMVRQAPGKGIRSEDAKQRRARVRAEQTVVRARLEAAQAQVVASVDTVVNAFIVNILDAKAAGLASIPGVRRVYPVRSFRLHLDHALPLHRVPQAWQQVGIGNAGRGIKIGMIDTGIDIGHPGFDDPSMTAPSGFPLVNAASDVAFTNGKVIVARSYASLFESPDPDPSARDRVGHGTATAMAAAGAQNTGPLATISGVAPKAWLGSYKVFGTPGVNDNSTDSAIIKAIDDAVADGMDVINLSLGTLEAPRVADDPVAQALERASALGVIVAVVVGNDGPDPETVDSPGTSPSAITVGGANNDRIFAATAVVAGGATVVAIPGSGANSATPVTAQLAAVSTFDLSGLACQALPAGSLKGRIALILRGDCNFSVKLDYAQQAGAMAALVYADAAQQSPFVMGVGTSPLPAAMIANSDGVLIQQQLGQNPALTATLDFSLQPQLVDAGGVVFFSSQGPSVDLSVKPELAAVADNFYTATQTFDPKGELYDPSGYTITQGTSFASPLVAGAAALLKAARPGLTNAQYKSLLVNSASAGSGTAQQTGAGILDVFAALESTAALAPSALSFQAGGASPAVTRGLTITNVGAASTVFQLSTVPFAVGPSPSLSATTFSLAPGASGQVAVTLSASSLPAGQYQGYIQVTDTGTGLSEHVPYWYAVPSGVPVRITVLSATSASGILFRVTDDAGIAVTDIQPVVSLVSGTATLGNVISRDAEIPGTFGVSLKGGGVKSMGGMPVVKIAAGNVSAQVSVP